MTFCDGCELPITAGQEPVYGDNGLVYHLGCDITEAHDEISAGGLTDTCPCCGEPLLPDQPWKLRNDRRRGHPASKGDYVHAWCDDRLNDKVGGGR